MGKSLIRSMYYYGSVEHFRAFLIRVSRHTDLHIREVSHCTPAFFEVGIRAKENKIAWAAIEVYEDINGCTINFIDSFQPFARLETPPIGQPFREFVNYITKEAPLVTNLKSDNTNIRDEEFIKVELESLRKQLRSYTKSLLRLQEKEAEYAGNTPVDLLNQMDKVTENIERVSTRIKVLEAL